MSGNTGQRGFEHSKINDVILLTADKDFGEIAFKNREFCKGIVLYRLHDYNNEEKAIKILDFFQNFSDQLSGSFSVINKKRIRIVPYN